MYKTYDQVGANFNRIFKPSVAWNIPMEVEIQIGPNWGEMQDLTREECNNAN